MHIVPIKELKDTAKISELCEATPEPIYITKNGYGHLVIMEYNSFEAYVENRCKEAAAKAVRDFQQAQIIDAVQEGIADIDAERGQDAFDLLNELEEQYAVQDRCA